MNTVVVLRDNLFKTPLGNVTCALTTSEGYFEITGEASYEHGHCQTISTRSHQIEFITFNLRLPLYNGEMVADSMGWLWRISKYSTGEGERIHLHYLSAFDKQKRESVNTWLAVDSFKRELENWIGIW